MCMCLRGTKEMRFLSLLLLLALVSLGGCSLVVSSSSVSTNEIPDDWKHDVASGDLLYSPQEPNDPSIRATIGNGYVAMFAGSDTIYVSGVFNGVGTTTPSHRARIPSPLSLSAENAQVFACGLNLREAYYEKRVHLSGGEVEVRIRSYVPRSNQNRMFLVTDLDIISTSSSSVLIRFTNNSGSESSDIHFSVISSSLPPGAEGRIGKTLQPEESGSPLTTVAVVYSTLPSQLTISPRGHFKTSYITAIRTSLDSSFPDRDAIEDYRRGMALSVSGALYRDHVASWETIWSSGISIHGDMDLARVVNSSLYYLLSSIRSDWPYSMSPGSLASNGYNGHTFWDFETWMYPPLLTFWPDIAESGLRYRFNRLLGAEKKAKSYNPPYDGAMFPWESAFTGEEVCPVSAPTGLYEQHISGDVVFAVQQYFFATNDVNWLKTTGWPIVKGVAEFIASRVRFDTVFQEYVVDGVIPPDEYAFGNNSAYTNVVFRTALIFASYACTIVGETCPQSWQDIIYGIRVPFDNILQYNPEYDGYNGQKIKQADVVLIGYPLDVYEPVHVRRINLEYYWPRTDPTGPAMTWSMYMIASLELGNLSAVSELFPRSYANAQSPFLIWRETPTGGTTNFITGVGGFLQAIVNGFGSLRIRKTGFTFLSPQLPPNSSVTEITLRRIRFLQSSVSLSISSDQVILTLESGPSVCVADAKGQTSHLDHVGDSFKQATQQTFTLQVCPTRASRIQRLRGQS